MPESGASTSPLGDLCNNNQLLKKAAGKKVIKKKVRSCKARREKLWSEAPWEAARGSAWPLEQLCRAGRYLCGGRCPGVQPASCRCCWGPASLGRTCCLLHRQTSGWLAGAHPQCIPPSLPPSLPPLPLSHRDPVQGGAIVTDTIPVLKPLQFANKTSSMARARSLLNIYESFLQGGNYCKLQFPFTVYPPPRGPLPQSTCWFEPKAAFPCLVIYYWYCWALGQTDMEVHWCDAVWISNGRPGIN